MGQVDLRVPPGICPDDEEAMLALKAEHVDAFKTCNPFSVIHGRWDIAVTTEEGYRSIDISKFTYNHGRLAWIDSSRRLIHVKNLEFGQQTQYTLRNREKAELIELTSDVVAVTTASGKCYAWDCTTGAPSSIQLPSAWVQNLFACGRTLAILHETADSGRVCITTWDLAASRTQSFYVKLHSRSWCQARGPSYEVHMTNDSVLFLERERGPPDRVFFTRCTLDGKTIAEGRSGPIDRTFRSGSIDLITWPQQRSTWTGQTGQLDRLRVQDEQDGVFRALRKTVVEGTRGIIRLVYNLDDDQIQSPWGPTIPCKDYELSDDKMAIGNWWYCWKNMAFRFCQDKAERPISTALDLQTGSLTETHMRTLDDDLWYRDNEGWATPRNERYMPDGRLYGHEPLIYYGDEVYMVRVYPNGFSAFCFDKNITMADEDEDFRQRREFARLQRIKRRDHPKEETAQPPERSVDIQKLEAELAQHERHLWAQEEGAGIEHGA